MLELPKEQLLELFNRLAFFEFFTSEEKELIAGLKSSIKGFANGEHIIRQGDPDCTVYLLIKGKVNITRKEKSSVVINTLKAGDVFGEIAFFCQRSRSTNVVANGDVMVLKMYWDLFGGLDVTIKNKVKDKFIEILIQRLEDMNKLLIEHSRL